MVCNTTQVRDQVLLPGSEGTRMCVRCVLLPAQLHPHAQGSNTSAVLRPWPAALHCHTTLASLTLLPALASRCVGSPSLPSISGPAGHRAIAVSVKSTWGHSLPARSQAGPLPRHLSAVPLQLPFRLTCCCCCAALPPAACPCEPVIQANRLGQAAHPWRPAPNRLETAAPEASSTQHG